MKEDFYFFPFKTTDVTLIHSLLQEHRDKALAKARYIALCNTDGCYSRTYAEYKKLISRYNRLLSIIHV